MSMCTVISCVVGWGCLLWPVHSLGRSLLAFALLHSVLQGQIWLLPQVLLEMKWTHPVMSNSLRPHGLYPTRFLCPWDFPGNSTRVGCHFLLQRIFLTQGLNPGLLHCRQTLYLLSHKALPTFAFLSPIMKRTSFLVLVLEGFVGLHRTVQLQLLQHYRLGHSLGLP